MTPSGGAAAGEGPVPASASYGWFSLGALLLLAAGNLTCLVMIPKLITQRGKFHNQTNGVLAVLLDQVLNGSGWMVMLLPIVMGGGISTVPLKRR